MDWLMPAGFWWLLAALPLVALFLLKPRPRERLVSTLRFWQQVQPEGPASRWLHRWRDRAMLLLNLLLLLLLVAAIAEPVWRSSGANGAASTANRLDQTTDWVVVIDTSASLQASQGSTARWELLRRELQDFVGQLRGSSQVALLSTTGSTLVTLPWTESRRELTRVLAELAPNDSPGRLEEALGLARQMAATRPAARVRVFSDGPGYATAAAGLRDACEWTTVGEPVDNTAITQFQVRRSFADPLAFEAWVEVSRFARSEKLAATLELLLDEELIDVVPVSLEAGEVWRQAWTPRSREGGVVTCRLMADGQPLRDALLLDNQAQAVLQPRPAVRVDLVSPGSVYLENVLRAIPWVDLHVHRELPSSRPTDSILVMHRRVPGQLPPGKSLCVDLRESNDAWRSGAVVDNAELAAHDEESPWLRHVNLRDSQLAGVRELEFLQPATSLLTTLGGVPVYARLTHARGTTLVFNVDLDQGDLAWRTAFPLWIAEALQTLLGEDEAYQAAIRAGQMVRLAGTEEFGARESGARESNAQAAGVPADRSDSLVAPSGFRLPLARDGNVWLAGPLEEAGVWSRESRGGAGADEQTRGIVRESLAVNLVDARESDLRDAVSPPPASRANAVGGLPPWKWLAVLVLMFSSLEWFLHQRRYLGG